MQLGDLLSHPSLGLECLVEGTPTARLRAIRGAHAIETVNPSRWVPADWVVLTTGMRLRDDPDAARGLVAELAGRDVAALGFGVGIVFDAVPADVVDEARRRRLPLFTVPEQLPFREVVRTVDSAVLAGDLETYRRTTAVTDALVRQLVAAEPEPGLVITLARELGCAASLHDVDGRATVLSDDTRAAAARWLRLAGRPLGGPPVEVVGADGLFAATVVVDGRIEAWLTVEVARRSAPVPQIVRAVTTATRLLQGLRTARAGEAVARRARRAGALRAVLKPDEEPVVPDRATRGPASPYADVPDPAEPATVLVAAGDPATAEPLLSESLLRRRRRHVVAEIGGAAVAWVPDEAPPAGAGPDAGGPDTGASPGGTGSAAAAGIVDTDLPDVPIGLAHSPGGRAALRAAHREAVLAAAHAAATGARLVTLDELPRLTRLLARAGPEVVRACVGDVLDPLAGAPHLVEALSAWLRHAMSVRATAAALGLHENSVRHRLQRAAALLGRDLDDPALVAELALAAIVAAHPGP